jgi:hypothetical protein
VAGDAALPAAQAGAAGRGVRHHLRPDLGALLVAPQTASVCVSTTEFVRNEGEVIRQNMGWTPIVLVYLIGIGAFWFFLFLGVMRA